MAEEEAAVVVVVAMKAKDGKLDEALEVFRPCLEATHKEEGNLTYALHRNAQDPNAFVLIERWRSQADIDEHMKSPHIADLFANVGPLLDGAPSMHFTTPFPVGDPAKGILH
jgi:quinol monooxygenase YgiN